MTTTQEFINDDCYDYCENLPSKSVELIYFDPPFNTTNCKYDQQPLRWTSGLWDEMWRVLTDDGCIVIHCSQPFTADLIATQRKHFRYNWYWDKDCVPTGHLFSKKQPMRMIEEVCVFYKKWGAYNPQMTLRETALTTKPHCGYTSHYYAQSEEKKIENTKKDAMWGWIAEKTYTHRFPTHYIKMKRIQHKYSTRPVELCEYFIKTYTKENDMVLDLTCSNGQSAIASYRLKRNYIGVDINEKMIEDAKENYEKNKIPKKTSATKV